MRTPPQVLRLKETLPDAGGHESGATPAGEVRGGMPEAGELDAAIQSREIKAGCFEPFLQGDVAGGQGGEPGAAAGQYAHIDKAIDEAILHAVFRQRGFTGIRRFDDG